MRVPSLLASAAAGCGSRTDPKLFSCRRTTAPRTAAEVFFFFFFFASRSARWIFGLGKEQLVNSRAALPCSAGCLWWRCTLHMAGVENIHGTPVVQGKDIQD
jgi:hypothetical protein